MDDDAAALVLVTRLARAASRLVDQSRPEITLREFSALSALRGACGHSQRELAESLTMDANGLTVVLNGLEDRGLVTRRPDPSDRRRHRVDITAEGRRALAAAEPSLGSAGAAVLAGLDPDERARLRELVAKALGDAGPGPALSMSD